MEVVRLPSLRRTPVLVGTLCWSTVLAVRCCDAVDVLFWGGQQLGAMAIQQLKVFLH